MRPRPRHLTILTCLHKSLWTWEQQKVLSLRVFLQGFIYIIELGLGCSLQYNSNALTPTYSSYCQMHFLPPNCSTSAEVLSVTVEDYTSH